MKTLYCDLDEVLCDFSGGYKKLTGMHIADAVWTYGEDWAWKQIEDYGKYDFWFNLKPTDWYWLLWQKIKQYKPKILTSPGWDEHGEVAYAKKKWVHKYLDPSILVIVDNNKSQYSTIRSMLIDDRYKNRCDWYAKGGHTVCIHNYETMTKELPQIKEFMDGY